MATDEAGTRGLGHIGKRRAALEAVTYPHWGLLFGDIVGVVIAEKVAAAWFTAQGVNPLKWRGVGSHLMNCAFCLGFWVGVVILVTAGINPLHAFTGGAAALMCWMAIEALTSLQARGQEREDTSKSDQETSLDEQRIAAIKAERDALESAREAQQAIRRFRNRYVRPMVPGSLSEDDLQADLEDEELKQFGG